MPNLTEEQILSIAQQVISERKIHYDREEGLKARYRGEDEDDNGQPILVWTVSYLTPKSMFDQNMWFIRIDDKLGEFMYILGPSSRIY